MYMYRCSMHMQTEGYIPKCSQNVGSVHAKKLTKVDKKSAYYLYTRSHRCDYHLRSDMFDKKQQKLSNLRF